MRAPLFVKQDFILHSGTPAHWKIECDSLTDEDIATLALIIVEKTSIPVWEDFCAAEDKSDIRRVHGVPRGGVKLAKALEQYIDPNGTIDLIVDDVLTTGASMEQAKKELGWKNVFGVVIFARGQYPHWIYPIFDMRWFYTKQ